jgi:hypothetical protein
MTFPKRSSRSFGVFRRHARMLVAVLTLHAAGSGIVCAQVSSSAYRALGQSDLRRNGVNAVLGIELYNPLGIALDTRSGQTHLYISDAFNSRVLAWADVNAYQIGDAPSLVLGQPGPQ